MPLANKHQEQTQKGKSKSNSTAKAKARVNNNHCSGREREGGSRPAARAKHI